MAKIKAILLKPLNGHPIGSEAEFETADFDRLKSRNAVKTAPANSSSKPKTKAAPKPKNKAAPKPANKSAS